MQIVDTRSRLSKLSSSLLLPRWPSRWPLSRGHAPQRGQSRLSPLKMFAILMTLVIIQGCTNSRLIISPLYNRLDDQMRKEFHKLAEFNEEQTANFEARLGTYHVWHRQSELPKYAELMKTVAASIKNSDTTPDDIKQWMTTAEVHTSSLRECHPINFSLGMMKTLTDEQFNFIERRWNKEQTQNRARYDARTPEERIERRVNNTVKWARRIGFEFTATQRSILLSTFKRQTSLRKEYYELSAAWNSEFFNLAREQQSPTYESDLASHLNRLWTLLETSHNEQWQTNRDLWKDSGFKLVDSMTTKQRTKASGWIGKMAQTLSTISGYTPSFKTVDDPALGCLVDSQSS